MCMFGGLRFKRTDLLTTCSEFGDAIRVCDNQHSHLPYSVQNNRLDTSLAAEYPKDFCKALVQVVQFHFNTKFGWKLGIQQQPKRSQQAALASGAQPLKKMLRLVQEYSHIQVIQNLPPSFEFPLDGKRCFSTCVEFGVQQPLIIHKGTKLLRRTIINGGPKNRTTNTDDLTEAVLNPMMGSSVPPKKQCKADFCEDCEGRVIVELCQDEQETLEIACGVFRSPEEFVKACCSIPPKDIFIGVSEEVRHAIQICASRPSHEIILQRMQWLGKYIQAARDLAVDEKRFMDFMTLEKKILECKRLRLLEKMVVDEGYPDKTLPQDIASAFLWLAMHHLRQGSRLQKLSRLRWPFRPGDVALDEELWAKTMTMTEVEKGWLVSGSFGVG